MAAGRRNELSLTWPRAKPRPQKREQTPAPSRVKPGRCCKNKTFFLFLLHFYRYVVYTAC